ncbi:MAG TPA: glycine zipper 2TM domain-containing protein [Casimicrobiaceae bacterium]|nr:glycine zipper 2TM domain-containing protein [Casimicrobiaceae bacterium]
MKRHMLSISLVLLGSSLFAGSIAATEFSDQAQVNSVRAVFGSAPQTRCWVDREQIRDERRGEVNVPGAVVGAIVGGVLGHQVGGGRGRDVATAGGAVAGAVVGGNVGRDDRGDRYGERAVQRCEQIPSSGQPDYWDVEYTYGGQVFDTRLNYAPGPQMPVRVSVEPE